MAQITLYQHPDYTGKSLPLSAADSNLTNDKFNNETSSCIVTSGEWQLFEHPNYEGKSVKLKVGRYENAKEMGIPNNSVSSLRPLPDVE